MRRSSRNAQKALDDDFVDISEINLRQLVSKKSQGQLKSKGTAKVASQRTRIRLKAPVRVGDPKLHTNSTPSQPQAKRDSFKLLLNTKKKTIDWLEYELSGAIDDFAQDDDAVADRYANQRQRLQHKSKRKELSNAQYKRDLSSVRPVYEDSQYVYPSIAGGESSSDDEYDVPHDYVRPVIERKRNRDVPLRFKARRAEVMASLRFVPDSKVKTDRRCDPPYKPDGPVLPVLPESLPTADASANSTGPEAKCTSYLLQPGMKPVVNKALNAKYANMMATSRARRRKDEITCRQRLMKKLKMKF